ncbi:MAG: hypothetical protein WC785_09990 [Tatlockia sp.]|jgi:hypothetical protein
MGHTINIYDLQVGQWVKFFTKKSLNSLSEKQQKLYQAELIFLVVTREDVMYDSCRCNLVDNNGQLYDYCPRTKSLNSVDFSGDNVIEAFSHEEIESVYGKDNMLMIAEMAQKHLEGLSEYSKKYAGKILDVDSILQNQAFPKGIIW